MKQWIDFQSYTPLLEDRTVCCQWRFQHLTDSSRARVPLRFSGRSIADYQCSLSIRKTSKDQFALTNDQFVLTLDIQSSGTNKVVPIQSRLIKSN